MAEKKRPVGRPKGIPRAETAGRKKGSGEKNKQLFGYRFTENEYLKIKENFKEFQKMIKEHPEDFTDLPEVTLKILEKAREKIEK